MKTESELKLAGVRALIAALGPVDARTLYRSHASEAYRLHTLERRPMAGCDRRRTGGAGAGAACAGGDTRDSS